MRDKELQSLTVLVIRVNCDCNIEGYVFIVPNSLLSGENVMS